MERVELVLCLLLGVSVCVPMISLAQIKRATSQLDHVQRFYQKAQKVRSIGDQSVECALCGIVVNEVQGFVAENISLEFIENEIDANFCNLMSGELSQICDSLVADLPSLVESIENSESVSVICVNYGYCTAPFSEPTDPQDVPVKQINLDLPPNQRWTEVCSDPKFQNITKYLVNTVNSLLSDNGVYLDELGRLLNDWYFPTELAQEIQGCAQSLGLSYGWVTLLNIGYEVSDACTSIVAQTTDGKILHARNMDFWAGMGFTDSLKDICFTAEFQTGGKTSFYATTFAGYVGVLSGMKPGAFSVSIDTRFYPEGLGQLFYEVIAAIVERNASLVSFLTREVMSNENDFNSAISNLSNDELIADVYYIVGGVKSGEGAVISRNRMNATDVWMLDLPTRWFEVETNYDHWEQPPWFDDRVRPANDAMNALGQSDLSLPAMLEVLSVKPVLNIQSTFTMLACPADGTYKSYTRYCQYPCVE